MVKEQSVEKKTPKAESLPPEDQTDDKAGKSRKIQRRNVYFSSTAVCSGGADATLGGFLDSSPPPPPP